MADIFTIICNFRLFEDFISLFCDGANNQKVLEHKDHVLGNLKDMPFVLLVPFSFNRRKSNRFTYRIKIREPVFEYFDTLFDDIDRFRQMLFYEYCAKVDLVSDSLKDLISNNRQNDVNKHHCLLVEIPHPEVL